MTELDIIAAAVDRLLMHMTTRDLLVLRTALTLDRQHAATPDTVLFCDDRIARIDRILQARAVRQEDG
jgi:hypothetical protein